MSSTSESKLRSRFFYAGILFAVNVGILGLIWRFREANWILLAFSLWWILLVSAFAWEIVTRAERLDRTVRSRTDALRRTNRHLSSLLGRLRAFHRLSYQMNQKLDRGEIGRAFVEELCDGLPAVGAAWLWLGRTDGDPDVRPRPFRLAARAGPRMGMPAELRRLRADSPLVAGCFGERAVAIFQDLPAAGRKWGWHWVSETGMQSFAALRLHLGDRTLGVLGVFSEQRLSPEFLRQLHLSVNQLTVALEKARLLKQVRRRARELADANKQLRQLDEMKDWFVSAVSHELRTPLTNIRSFGEILENYADLEPEERKEFAGIIRRESERLSALIGNVLDVAKIANGEIELEPQALDLPALVERCCSPFAREAAERGIDLSCSVRERPPAVFADENAVARVLNNLLGNALKFTPDGGRVEVTVKPVGTPRQDRRMVAVLVSDTGVGIPADQQEKVFRRFTQLGKQLTDKPPGTGIGLAICREIVENSGGRIWVESTPGEGSTFAFSLPVADSDRGARRESA